MLDEMLHIELNAANGAFRLRVSAKLPLTGVTAIFGPSGSGKSTFLELIAGHRHPDQGSVLAGSNVWVDTQKAVFRKPHRRPVGFVMQGAPLLNHLTALGNLEYAYRRHRRAPVRFGLSDVCAALDLDPLLTRRPGTLSGGERQRVALGQALLTQPEVLLLDEPLAALDRARKAEILPYLQDMSSIFGLPILLVSHDLEEVVRLADRVLVLKEGAVVGFGEVSETLNQHGFTVEAAEQAGVILSGRIQSCSSDLMLMTVGVGADTLFLPLEPRRRIGDMIPILIQGRNVSLSVAPPVGLSIRNALKGRVKSVEILRGSAFVEVAVDLGSAVLPVRVTRAAVEALAIGPDLEIWALIKTVSLADWSD